MSKFDIRLGDCLDLFREMDDDSVDLVVGSPPYALKGRRYGDSGPRWKVDEWVEWMLQVTTAAVRVTRGHVIWIANGAIKGGRYIPAVEGLVWEGYKQGLIGERSAIWHKKNAPPTRHGVWLTNDWEPIVVFKTATSGLFYDWESIAQPKKYTSGGRFRQRTADGRRRMMCESCDWKESIREMVDACPKCGAKVISAGNKYPTNELANPRDVFYATVGGGHLAPTKEQSDIASENEAPYPEGIVEPWVKLLSPAGGVVLDPFSGSGTSGAVAIKNGRRYIGFENRESQVALTRRRLEAVL